MSTTLLYEVHMNQRSFAFTPTSPAFISWPPLDFKGDRWQETQISPLLTPSHQGGMRESGCGTERGAGSSQSAARPSRAPPPSSATCRGWTVSRGWRPTCEKSPTGQEMDKRVRAQQQSWKHIVRTVAINLKSLFFYLI